MASSEPTAAAGAPGVDPGPEPNLGTGTVDRMAQSCSATCGRFLSVVFPDGSTHSVPAASGSRVRHVLGQFPGHILSLSATRPLRLPDDTVLLRWNTYHLHVWHAGAASQLDTQHERKSLRALHRRKALGNAQGPHTTSSMPHADACSPPVARSPPKVMEERPPPNWNQNPKPAPGGPPPLPHTFPHQNPIAVELEGLEQGTEDSAGVFREDLLVEGALSPPSSSEERRERGSPPPALSIPNSGGQGEAGRAWQSAPSSSTADQVTVLLGQLHSFAQGGTRGMRQGANEKAPSRLSLAMGPNGAAATGGLRHSHSHKQLPGACSDHEPLNSNSCRGVKQQDAGRKPGAAQSKPLFPKEGLKGREVGSGEDGAKSSRRSSTSWVSSTRSVGSRNAKKERSLVRRHMKNPVPLRFGHPSLSKEPSSPGLDWNSMPAPSSCIDLRHLDISVI